jgi:lysophospholipid acyltransferase (LPLAT)-like uncharacterized protein
LNTLLTTTYQPLEPRLDAVSFGIWAIGTILGKTWRPEILLTDDVHPLKNIGKGNVFVFWHSCLLPLAYIFRNSRCTALISSSNDGKRAAAVAAKWNLDVVYGSSSKQGFTAFRQCLKTLKKSKNMVITPDGPKGPREVVKSGVAHLALLSGAPVLPLAVHPSNSWRLKSWDRMIIPKPFSKVLIKSGGIIIPGDFAKDETGIEQLRTHIEEKLHAITMA